MSARNLLWKKYSNPPLDKVPSIYYVITFRIEGVHKKPIIALLFVRTSTVSDFTPTLPTFSPKYDLATCNFDNCENSF